jgi:thiol:disulfide interchange protein DsbA
MKTAIRSMLALLVVLVSATACAADNTDGKQYQVLKDPQPTGDASTIEVVELFWYGCPHCYRLEPLIHEWLQNKPDDVTFIRMPAILGKGWELLAKGYFTAELLGVLDTVHSDLFAAIHEKNSKFRDEKELRDFFISKGVAQEDFDKMFNSFAVSVKVNNARLMTRRYAITGVPTLIVNGKYSTSGSLAGSNENIINVVDQLVAQERRNATAAAGQ